MVRVSLVAAACIAGGCALAQPAGATFPGANGSLLIGAGHCKRGTDCHGVTSTYVASPNASSFHRLPGQEPDLSGPFSADGRWVYTVRVEGEATRVYPLRVSNWRLGTPIGPRGRYNWVSPSPDGRRLLVVHVGPSTPEVTSGRQFIEVWSRDGRHRRRLVEGSQPTWSATNQIAYLCQHHQPDGGTLNNVCVIDPAGGNQRQLTATGAEQDSAPSWSPDGRRIVFARRNHNRGPMYGNEIGGYPSVVSTTLEANATVRVLATGRYTSYDYPIWSPDGRSILYRRGDRYLYTMRPDGSHRHLLLNAKRMGEGWVWPIDWQPLPR